MNFFNRTIASFCVGALAVLAFSHDASAQYSLDGLGARTTAARAEWEQRIVRGGQMQAPPQTAATAQADLTDYRYSPWTSYQRAPANRTAMLPRHGVYRRMARAEAGAAIPEGAEVVPLGPQVDSPPGGSGLAPVADAPQVPDGQVFGDCDAGVSADCGESCSCGECDPCGCCCGWIYWGGVFNWLLRDASVFAGVHGFKGPFDVGINGNFGFFEGVNAGAPVGLPWPIGFQVGFEATQSNLTGDQVIQGIGNRKQYFFTTGLFQRALCGGLQGGVALDVLSDGYFDTANLMQIRSESSIVFADGFNEIGYAGTYAISSDRLPGLVGAPLIQPTDMYTLFYRRYFETGGEGKVWAGLSGQGQALVGAEVRVPLGGSWAVENHFNYLIPNHSFNAGGFQESWGLSSQLVWYPGRPAASVVKSCFRPLFNVADNTTFMSRLP